MECNSWEAHLNKFPEFYGAKRFRVTCLQEPATGPYNEHNESSPLENCLLYNHVFPQLEHAHSEREASSSFFLVNIYM
jgi:hypothetical protein